MLLLGEKIMTLAISDYQAAATKLGVDIASVRAVASVESNGKGMFSDGRPAILFERHIFYRELLSKRNNEAKKQVKENNPTAIGSALDVLIASELRNVKNAVDNIAINNSAICNRQAGGYLGGVKEYDRLAKANAIDEECGLRSCSWGAFQVMGFHAEFLGFKNVSEMVQYASTDAGQLDIFIRFILKNTNLLKALKSKDWSNFARQYNGPEFAKNKYDVKLASAYNTYSTNPSIA